MSMELETYNQRGEKVGNVPLPAAVFGLPWNGDLVHQVLTAARARARRGTAKVKNRGEVRGGGRKPWRQKGTGRARHGSIRSPLWRGGGVTHGPTAERDYWQKIGKKMKRRALRVLLSEKVRRGNVLGLNQLKFPAPKTKEAAATLLALSRGTGRRDLIYRSGRRALVVLPEPEKNIEKSFRNLPQTAVVAARNLNLLELAAYKNLILVEPEANLKTLAKNDVALG